MVVLAVMLALVIILIVVVVLIVKTLALQNLTAWDRKPDSAGRKTYMGPKTGVGGPELCAHTCVGHLRGTLRTKNVVLPENIST